jgi:hypothetical protein
LQCSSYHEDAEGDLERIEKSYRKKIIFKRIAYRKKENYADKVLYDNKLTAVTPQLDGSE